MGSRTQLGFGSWDPPLNLDGLCGEWYKRAVVKLNVEETKQAVKYKYGLFPANMSDVKNDCKILDFSVLVYVFIYRTE